VPCSSAATRSSPPQGRCAPPGGGESQEAVTGPWLGQQAVTSAGWPQGSGARGASRPSGLRLGLRGALSSRPRGSGNASERSAGGPPSPTAEGPRLSGGGLGRRAGGDGGRRGGEGERDCGRGGKTAAAERGDSAGAAGACSSVIAAPLGADCAGHADAPPSARQNRDVRQRKRNIGSTRQHQSTHRPR
jgi:hypothetical protein